MDHKRLPIVKDTTGLGMGYKIGWWLQFFGYFFFGPADQLPHLDPRERLKRERARRVLRAHRKHGTEAPHEVMLVAGSD
ncbi:hypothetical protein ACTXOR_00745 [Arthrobacter rhombi]|uniref:Uncharacterized protein n=1 Tax=Arthrobacter rhombi TaxID=71253 RepID=A0A1R4GGT7_9MICC|nr:MULTISPECIES: hypothetical protein [Micrococcaceae]PCC25192.1 hypothetical protein CIK75_09240 [Glutamicibacter sp. BW78]SJM67313.1 hypothetical protein FM101_10370 [Arthrobacter rhombi]